MRTQPAKLAFIHVHNLNGRRYVLPQIRGPQALRCKQQVSAFLRESANDIAASDAILITTVRSKNMRICPASRIAGVFPVRLSRRPSSERWRGQALDADPCPTWWKFAFGKKQEWKFNKTLHCSTFFSLQIFFWDRVRFLLLIFSCWFQKCLPFSSITSSFGDNA